MPNREVKLGLMTYTDEDGAQRYALQGETVKVHPDTVSRFDELNVDMGPRFDPQRVEQELIAPTTAATKKAPAKKAE